MITSAISSAARLSLAPARLAGRMAGSLLRGLRGDDSGRTSPAGSSARTTPAPRSRAQEADQARGHPQLGEGAAQANCRPEHAEEASPAV